MSVFLAAQRGPERKNVVSHTVLATPALALRAYASVGLREGFANPVSRAGLGAYFVFLTYLIVRRLVPGK